YHWPKKDGSDVPPYTPSVVVTGFVARAMLAFNEKLQNDKVKEILKSMTSFVMNDVHLYKRNDGFCFSYTPIKKDLTINANLLAAEVLAYCDYLNNETKYHEYIQKVIEFTFNNQNDDGSWYYSFDYVTRKPKKQIDFHQGYVLESLLRLSKYSKVDMSDYNDNIKEGLKYYYEHQFNREGWAYWRLPSKYPVDIHNQSQGIITFVKFKDYNKKYEQFAHKISEWTIKNMQGSKGNFYYQKWSILNNKVNYLRWNQAWMLLALISLISSSTNKNENIY
ncbi:MAG: prenyltransferase/squalene oxidase repeat-containing protein, partial [Ignavibacteriaceae bacterium]